MANKITIVLVALVGLLIVADAATFEETMIKRIRANTQQETCVPDLMAQNIGFRTGCIPGVAPTCCEGSYCELRSTHGAYYFICTPCEGAYNPQACYEAIGK